MAPRAAAKRVSEATIHTVAKVATGRGFEGRMTATMASEMAPTTTVSIRPAVAFHPPSKATTTHAPHETATASTCAVTMRAGARLVVGVLTLGSSHGPLAARTL